MASPNGRLNVGTNGNGNGYGTMGHPNGSTSKLNGSTSGASGASDSQPLYSIPIKQRPEGYGSWFSALLFPLLFNLGILGINSAQFLFQPLRLFPGVYESLIDWSKDGFGRLLIAITVLFAPTNLVITHDDSIAHLVKRDSNGAFVGLNLPPRLVVMSNHQAYMDWMYLWMVACYAGHAEGLTILLKASLKNIPIVGWGMRFFRFIFLHRSWAADKENLTTSLRRLAKRSKNSSLWMLIFPEGTITSDDERSKSARYAKKEQVDDFVGVLHPRSTGLLFCLRTLSHQIPDLGLLDVTIGYPGVPFGKYPQEWYGLGSVFWRSVPPPVVRIHLHLYENLTPVDRFAPVPSLTGSGVASPEEAREFELWLRGIWVKKEAQVERFAQLSATAINTHRPEIEVNDGECEVVPIQQLSWKDWFAAFGGGGMGTAATLLYLAKKLV